MAELDYAAFDALTFDCYGTLIDWETGILAGLRPAINAHGIGATDEELLEAYAAAEAELEAGPYLPYRAILARGLRKVVASFGAAATDEEAGAFGASVGEWPAFDDSTRALRRLRTAGFRLGVLTNCDDDLFAASNRRLGVDFDWVVTAQQVGAYKPSHRNFDVLLERLAHQGGVSAKRVLHVAQSLFHDHVPAHKLGIRTVWIDRRHDKPGAGATPPAEARPDATFRSMEAFADAAIAGRKTGR
jgi:2-haloalkanoic acid dehalogenase type II